MANETSAAESGRRGAAALKARRDRERQERFIARSKGAGELAMVLVKQGRNPDAEDLAAITKALSDAHQETARLTALINTPRTDDFLEAVRLEAAHQIERWGTEHDAGKRPEDWVMLLVYLLGKASKAHFDGDRDKLLHHVITVAAVCLNWHRNVTGESTAMRPGVGP